MKKFMLIVGVLALLQAVNARGEEKSLSDKASDFFTWPTKYYESRGPGYRMLMSGTDYPELGKKTAIVGGGATVAAAAGYGLYLGGKALYNWFRGPLHQIKSELHALQDKTQKLINYVKKHDKTTSSPQMKALLERLSEENKDTQTNQNLYSSKRIFNQFLTEIKKQEAADKKINK